MVDKETGLYLDESRFLIRGRPAPKLRANESPEMAAYYGYIDDYGVYAMENGKLVPASAGLARRLRDLLWRRRYAELDAGLAATSHRSC